MKVADKTTAFHKYKNAKPLSRPHLWTKSKRNNKSTHFSSTVQSTQLNNHHSEYLPVIESNLQTNPDNFQCISGNISATSIKHIGSFATENTKMNMTKKTNSKDKMKMQFNRLYGLDQNHLSQMEMLRTEQHLSWEEHQNILLNISTNLSRDNWLKLSSRFKNLRILNDNVKPLPKFNFQMVHEHSLNEIKRKNANKKVNWMNNFRVKDVKDEKDEFEVLMENIKRKKYCNWVKENPNSYQIYETWPEYVIDALFKKKQIK